MCRSVTDVGAGVGFVYRCVFRSQGPSQDTEVAHTCLTAVVTFEIWKKLHFQIKGQAKEFFIYIYIRVFFPLRHGHLCLI